MKTSRSTPVRLSPREFRFVKEIPWPQLLKDWKKDEATVFWERSWRRKGFSSWRAWRQDMVDELHLSQQRWRVYQLPNFQTSIPTFRIGPFAGWKHRYGGGRRFIRFRGLIQNPVLRRRTKIRSLAKHFPDRTKLFGFQTSFGIVILEGMHRSTSVAYAQSIGRSLQSDVSIALARVPDSMIFGIERRFEYYYQKKLQRQRAARRR